MAELPARPRYRKLGVTKSVMLALADRYMHGPVLRSQLDPRPVTARYESRCDDCGLPIRPGDLTVLGYRPKLQSRLWVHPVCPRPNLFDLEPWLTRWEGADVVSGWFAFELDQPCFDCGRRQRGPDDLFALVRRPGPLRHMHKHSDYKCRECVKI